MPSSIVLPTLLALLVPAPLRAQTHPWMDTGTFAPGDVFTIEPGIYVSTRLLDILPDTPRNRTMTAKVRAAVTRYNNIGIRIEDDYAITPTGVEWLSRAPREPAEIESAMARRGR